MRSRKLLSMWYATLMIKPHDVAKPLKTRTLSDIKIQPPPRHAMRKCEIIQMTFLTCALSLSRPCDSSQFIVEKGENNKGQFLTSHRTVSNVMFVAAFFGDTAESHVLLCTTTPETAVLRKCWLCSSIMLFCASMSLYNCTRRGHGQSDVALTMESRLSSASRQLSWQ